MNVLSLFDGMSCGQIALERVGIKVDNYFASEIDKYAIKVAQKNYPNTIQLGDVSKWATWDLPDIDLIIGGSPCQGFSFAGKQLNFSDPRSKLFFEFVDVLNRYKPRNFMLENVRMKMVWRDVISNLLNVQPIQIDSNLVSAQNRRRLYWTNIQNVTQPEDSGIMLGDIVDGATSSAVNFKRRGHGFLPSVQYITSKTPALFCGSGDYFVSTGGEYRKLTPVECERLQNLPDNYTDVVSNTQRYKMIGNGWTVDVIVHIFKGLLNENL